MSLLSDLTGDERRFLATFWANRASLELGSEARFRRLAGQLAEVEALPDIVELAARAALDEQRHAVLCADMARYFGGATATVAPRSDEIAPAHLSARERVLYEMVAFCCLGETANAAYLTTLLHHARDPAVRAATRDLLRDEMNHSRLGWAHLEAERRRGVSFLAGLLPAILAASIPGEVLAPEPAREASGHRPDFGDLPRSERIEIFRQTLRDVVFPGLRAAGVDPGPAHAWMERTLP